MNVWFDATIARRAFRKSCGSDVKLTEISVSRPEVREIKARYKIAGEVGIERFVCAMCGGGAAMLAARCEALGAVAAKRAAELVSA